MWINMTKQNYMEYNRSLKALFVLYWQETYLYICCMSSASNQKRRSDEISFQILHREEIQVDQSASCCPSEMAIHTVIPRYWSTGAFHSWVDNIKDMLSSSRRIRRQHIYWRHQRNTSCTFFCFGFRCNIGVVFHLYPYPSLMGWIQPPQPSSSWCWSWLLVCASPFFASQRAWQHAAGSAQGCQLMGVVRVVCKKLPLSLCNP